MRLAGDVAGTRKAVTDILQLCFDARAWKTLNDQIVVLSKRRGQLKQVLAAAELRLLFLFCFPLVWKDLLGFVIAQWSVFVKRFRVYLALKYW